MPSRDVDAIEQRLRAIENSGSRRVGGNERSSSAERGGVARDPRDAASRDRTRPQLDDQRRRITARDAVENDALVRRLNASTAGRPKSAAAGGLARPLGSGSGISRDADRSTRQRTTSSAASGLASGTAIARSETSSRTRAFGELNSSAEFNINDSSNVTINNINKIKNKNKNVSKSKSGSKDSWKHDHDDDHHDGHHDGHHHGHHDDDDFVFVLSVGSSFCSPWFAPHWGWCGWSPASYCNWFASDLCWFDDNFSFCLGINTWPVANCVSWNSWCVNPRPFCFVCGGACCFPSLHFVSYWPAYYGGSYYSSGYTSSYYEPQPYPYEPPKSYEDGAAPVPLISMDEAWDLLIAGSFAEAQDGFMGLVLADFDAGQARVGYALAAALQGKSEAAVTAMRRAMREDPGALRAVPSNAALDERIRAAMETFAARVRTTPNDVDALFMVATMRYLLGDDAVAYFALDAAMQHGDLDPSTANLARLLEEGMKKRLYEPAP